MADETEGALRQGFVLPNLQREETPSFFAGLAPHLLQATAAELSFAIQADGSMVPFLPHWNAPPHQSQELVTTLRSILAEIYQNRCDRHVDPSRLAPRSLEMAGHADAIGAAVHSLFAALRRGDAIPSGSMDALCVLRGPLSETVEAAVAVVRRSRYPALSVLRDEEQDDVIVIRFSDAEESGATLEGLRAGFEGELPLFDRIATASGSVWCPRGLGLPPDQRGDVSGILDGLAKAGVVDSDSDLLIMPPEPERLLYLSLPLEMSSADLDDISDHGVERAAITVHRLEARPSKPALAALQEKIAAARFPLGYRVALHRTLEVSPDEQAIERLREEIDERAAAIELLQALTAPQLGLLRFSDAQLPALVDGLRKMPPKMLRDAGLTFATCHSAGKSEPSYFVLYDPAKAAVEGVLPEHYWRARTEDHPMRYWLDPHAAEAMTKDSKAPFVFTPVRHRILPAIDSYGGRLGENLRLILGNLFSEADAVLAAPDARPAFVFSPSPDSGAEMEVEVFDLSRFEPLELAIKWLNDHLMVRSPRIPEADDLKRLAEDLYQGELVETIRSELDADLAALEAVWSDGSTRVLERANAVLEHMTGQLSRTAERLGLGFSYLERVREKVEDMDRVLDATRSQLDRLQVLEAEFAELPEQLSAERMAMVESLLTEFRVGERTLEQAKERVRVEKDRIAVLLSRLGIDP
ncbi:hypothetical protein [Poseidonocella sedimentorum]|uniref:Uncharacterized protein n=1 Tax=Poseidonocella sedimentorum TaxID=871652 RepID=A0A1I6CWD3_9RHOB|nr:hypothetical protein [Poseidonocella sedimentorum]SFQ97432.1 hypothetical protein SAMN04515673_101476 [Poseidonocella sedimentorum]